MAKGCDIVLIFPPIRVWDRPRNFPTGLGLIAARLRQAGYRVGVIDANGRRLSDAEVLEEIRRYEPRVIGIGGLITTYGWIKRMSGRIRRLKPERPIVLGGSVGTSIVETALRGLDIDVLALGEADDTAPELLEALLNGRPLDEIAGLAFLREGQAAATKERGLIEDLDELPYPAWDMFPMEVYLANPIVGVGRDVDIISSRGCPFNCTYCYRIFGRRYRRRSAELVVGEMEALKRNYDVDFISFQDDCFVVDKERVYEICDLIDRKRSLRAVRWSCTGRTTVCDKEMLRRMRASGCVSVSYGIESGSDKILRAMDKKATRRQAREAIENTRGAGLRCPVSFMIGYPGETRETMAETVAFCQEMNIPLTSLMFTCPYPGTALYEQVKGRKRFQEQFAREEDFVLKLSDAVELTVNLTEMSDEELKGLRDEALAAARENYRPPGAAEVEAQEKELYGEELYQKAREQGQTPALQAHRRRHGFNEDGNLVQKIKIGGVRRKPGWVDGSGRCPYIIAEAGVNHNGQLDLALHLAAAAKEAGADCVKFQAFTAEELVVKGAAKADYQKGCGRKGESQYEMLRRYELTESDFKQIKDYCDEREIDFLVTPFSTRWVEVFNLMGATAFKIGSGSLTDLELLRTIGQTQLPVIVSTGMADMEAVQNTINLLHMSGSQSLAVLYCISMYPTSVERVDLKVIKTLQESTRLPVGFSDHTEQVETGAIAVAKGAVILEKHFTLDKSRAGPDHKMSLEPEQLRQYIAEAKKMGEKTKKQQKEYFEQNPALSELSAIMSGSGRKEPLEEELEMKKVVGLSVVATKGIKGNIKFIHSKPTVMRPATGISAEHLDIVKQCSSAHDIKAGQIIHICDIKKEDRNKLYYSEYSACEWLSEKEKEGK